MNTHSLLVDELTERVNQLEQENQKLRRAADMLTEIAKLVKNAGGNSTTLEAVAWVRGRAVMQKVYAFLALDALEFDAGQWSAENKVQYLREQIRLTKDYLIKLDTDDFELDQFIVLAKADESPTAFVYSDIHYNFRDALADCLEHQDWADCKIRYKGVDLVVSGGDQ
jgi:hypothetical protein